MKLHANARTCSHCRALIVSRITDDGQTLRAVATDFRVSDETVRKWLKRFQADGLAGLTDRSCRPHRIARRNLQPGKELHDAVFSLLHTPPSTPWRATQRAAWEALKKAESVGLGRTREEARAGR